MATGFTRQLAATRRATGNTLGAEGESSHSIGLSRMNSFALALLLGGLARAAGHVPLDQQRVAEERKEPRRLRHQGRVDPPASARVRHRPHLPDLEQGVQHLGADGEPGRTSTRTILDALDYAQRVDAEQPNDINIIYAIGGIYVDKLGDSAEKAVLPQARAHANRCRTRRVRSWRRPIRVSAAGAGSGARREGQHSPARSGSQSRQRSPGGPGRAE